jgi:hypothetical protein
MGWKRTKLQSSSRFRTPTGKALTSLMGEIRRLGGRSLVISSNVPLKADGTMRADREPVDPGVAVYFVRDGKQVVFACDKYENVGENILAIAKTIEALRGIERWGASEMMERAFTGFKELPDTAGKGEDCWMVLGLPLMSPANLVTLVHRDLVRKLHARDALSEEFARINVARDDAMAALVAAVKGE